MDVKSDWEEVKRLAADFQLTQTAATLQRLSERNCVQIVSKLTQLNLLDIIFTSDGKEYLTPDHLLREIQDELYMAGGRISFHELANILNVDYSHVEAKSKELARLPGGNITFVADELISKDFKEQLALEINERLQKKGVLEISDLTRVYSLPADFLQQIILTHLGTLIDGVQDTGNRLTFFTKNYLEQYKAKITGVLSAITRPISVPQIVNKYGFPEKIFNSVVDELLRSGRLTGQLTSGSNKTFIPNIYSLTQKEWIENFYRHNGYLEYDALARVGITEPKALKKRPGFEDLVFLSTCCVGPSVFVQLEGAVDDCLASRSWTNLTEILPSILDEDDIKRLIEAYKSQNEDKIDKFTLLNQTIFISNDFVIDCIESLVDAMKEKAENEHKNGVLFKRFSQTQSQREKTQVDIKISASLSKKEEKKRKTGAKTFSTQGREVKTKAVKKKYRTSQREDSDGSDVEDSDPNSAIDVSDLLDKLRKKIDFDGDADSEIIDTITDYMIDPLRVKYLEISREYFTNSMSKETSSLKKTHAEIQQSINSLFVNITIFDKGLKSFDNELIVPLSKYLLRTLCSDLVDNALFLVLEDHKRAGNIVLPLTIEARQKIINKLDGNFRDSFLALNATLNEASLDNFFNQLDMTLEVCDIMIKKVDKKRETQMMSELRQNIIVQIEEADSQNYALILHLSVLFLTWSTKQSMLHASGKFVPQILSALKPLIPSETYELFHECEQLIVRQVKAEKEGSVETKEEIQQKLSELIPRVKAIALNFPTKS